MRIWGRTRRASVPALLAAVALPAISIAADQAAAPAATSPSANEGSTVSEIVVTALKRSESIQQVPASISALTGANLVQRGISDINELQFAVPSMTSGSILGATQITIRGIGPGPGGPSIAVYVDGVYQPNDAIADLQQTDLSRVEQLRGPQGTLYGRNAIGGAINFISNAPTDQLGGYLQAVGESYAEFQLQGEINIPITQNVRSRLVVDYDDRLDGFIKNVVPGQEDLDKGENISGRYQIDADLSDKVTLDLNLTGQHSSGPLQYFTLHNPPDAAGLALNPYLKDAIVPTAPFLTSANGPSGTDQDYLLAAGTLTWKSPIGEVKSITAYQYYSIDEFTDQDATQLSAFDNHNTNYDNTFTEELNLTNKLGPVDAIFGAFFMDDRLSTRTFYSFPLGIFPLPPESYLLYHTPQDQTISTAGYLDLTWNVTHRFRLLGGVRYSNDDETYLVSNQLGSTASGTPIPFAILVDNKQTKLSFGSLTGRAGAQYDIDDNQNVYATFSSGYLAGGLNTTVEPATNTYSPETILAYEVGYKSRLFSSHLTFDASAFYYDFTNLQVQQTVGLSLFTLNAASARVYGSEFQADWIPDRHWTIDANLTLLDAQYVQFLSTNSLDPALGDQNVSGNYLNNAPKVSTNVGIGYRTDKMSWGQLLARVDVAYRSKVYFREFNLPLDEQPGYAVVNIGLTWVDPSEKYSIRIFDKNVGNEGYIVTMGTSNNFGSRYITWGTPQQAGVEIRAKF